MSILKKNTIKKKQINIFVTVPEFEADNNKEYKVKAIQNNAIYTKKAGKYLPGLYYLIV